jgi:hypothetical protein
VRSGCNQRLNDTEVKGGVRAAFESYQLALRRAIQSRQATFLEAASGVGDSSVAAQIRGFGTCGTVGRGQTLAT